ncbi:MAG: hypothetical protein IPK83_10325 [Planctomycetes bacterium]|nr:hypothetical protein [Planctomycetota bacterium]
MFATKCAPVFLFLCPRAATDASPTRAEPALPVQWFVGNVALVFRQGRLLHHRFKIYEHDIADDKKTSGQEKWAMFTLSLAARRQLAHSRYLFDRAISSLPSMSAAIMLCVRGLVVCR